MHLSKFALFRDALSYFNTALTQDEYLSEPAKWEVELLNIKLSSAIEMCVSAYSWSFLIERVEARAEKVKELHGLNFCYRVPDDIVIMGDVRDKSGELTRYRKFGDYIYTESEVGEVYAIRSRDFESIDAPLVFFNMIGSALAFMVADSLDSNGQVMQKALAKYQWYLTSLMNIEGKQVKRKISDGNYTL